MRAPRYLALLGLLFIGLGSALLAAAQPAPAAQPSAQPVVFTAVDNLRPIVPKRNAENTVLLWFRGKYHSYRNYQTEVVMLMLR